VTEDFKASNLALKFVLLLSELSHSVAQQPKP